MLDRNDAFGQEAQIEYLDAHFRVVRPGKFVRCAVTGDPIPLDRLVYWSVERQEPYSSHQAVMQRLGLKPKDVHESGVTDAS
ncbi:DUF2093 domain-containing protein [Saliniramus sp.]|uniref:DUF2093 domain-containing protein n=1 Tax=Saliniramus sp. TaxID=2986772 RepID=UPI002CCE2CCE|nr:DUF2093 domain-containing protein [Saliniramus sp.]HMB11089.1 DUF2093 domain-containing protein [Saliniramus sp.]